MAEVPRQSVRNHSGHASGVARQSNTTEYLPPRALLSRRSDNLISGQLYFDRGP